MTDWVAAQKKAAKTARWAVTMTKVRIARMLSKTKWQLITFLGPAGQESVGIVDMMAVRKNHAPCKSPAKRGDCFDIILIQVKGGSSSFPSADELRRSRLVGRSYRAKAVLLAQWKRGAQAEFFSLRKSSVAKTRDNWTKLDSPVAIFR